MEAPDPRPAPQHTAASVAAQARSAALETLRRQMQSHTPFWVFAYGSLMWKPAFDPSEQRRARVWGHHRALRMHSRLDRGTSHRPGLVFALLPGGSCQGLVQRVPEQAANDVLDVLWSREMDSGVYRPGWLHCMTADGPVRALSFVLPRRSPSHAGELSEAQLLEILRHAQGRYGRTLDYLLQTAAALQAQGIRDAHVQGLVSLARRHHLFDALHPPPSR